MFSVFSEQERTLRDLLSLRSWDERWEERERQSSEEKKGEKITKNLSLSTLK